MAGLRLNLGCGSDHRQGYVNVDKYGPADQIHDLETFPWPWADNSVSEILLSHVLEHLGQDVKVFLKIMQEMYRVCEAGAVINIGVPHFRSDDFYRDPTHVRAITADGMSLFSKAANLRAKAGGFADTPLALQLGVDFEVTSVNLTPSQHWNRLHPEARENIQLLVQESALLNNLIEKVDIQLKVIK